MLGTSSKLCKKKHFILRIGCILVFCHHFVAASTVWPYIVHMGLHWNMRVKLFLGLSTFWPMEQMLCRKSWYWCFEFWLFYTILYNCSIHPCLSFHCLCPQRMRLNTHILCIIWKSWYIECWCLDIFDKRHISWFDLVTNSTSRCCSCGSCCRSSCCCCCWSCACCCCGVWWSCCCLICQMLECEHFSMQI